ncbi:putative primase/helicase [Pseudomonas phage PIP]|nr:putative primase/helicase [Pseudomonas phage PIP]
MGWLVGPGARCVSRQLQDSADCRRGNGRLGFPSQSGLVSHSCPCSRSTALRTHSAAGCSAGPLWVSTEAVEDGRYINHTLSIIRSRMCRDERWYASALVNTAGYHAGISELPCRIAANQDGVPAIGIAQPRTAVPLHVQGLWSGSATPAHSGRRYAGGSCVRYCRGFGTKVCLEHLGSQDGLHSTSIRTHRAPSGWRSLHRWTAGICSGKA